MSMGSQDIAEARAAREYWEAMKAESEHDVRYQLSLWGFGKSRNDEAILVAGRTGLYTMENNDIRATVVYDGQGYHAQSTAISR